MGRMESGLMTNDGKIIESEDANGKGTRHCRQHQKGEKTYTSPIESIVAWTKGLYFRGQFDHNQDLMNFANTLEKICIETVESGQMTKDLAILVSTDTKWMNTEDFLSCLDINLQKKLA